MTQSHPDITIAMVTYNSEQYVEFAVKSILQSGYENFELIISDDHSTDNTWEIIQAIQDPRIRKFQNISNIGEYANRNKCLEYARGEYILYIDGDDYLYPHGLHYMITMLNAYPNAQMALMLSYNPNFIYPLELMPAQIYKSTFLGSSFMGISLTNTILRTSVLRKVGGFSTNYIAGDEYIRLKIALNHNALLINDGFTWHRERPGQAFEKLSNHWGTAEAMQYFKDVLSDKDCPLNDNEKKQALINVYGGLYRTLLRYLLRFRFKYAIKLFKHSGLSLKDAYMIIKKPVRNYKLYKAYTTIEEMNKNPFCLKSAIQ